MSSKKLKITIFILTIIFCLLAAQNHPDLIDLQSGRIQDLAYYVGIADYFWNQKAGDFYSLPYRIEALTYVFQRPAELPMPVLWSPSALFILCPFTLLFPGKMVLLHSIWTFIGVTVFLSIGLILPRIASIAILAAAILAPINLETLVSGQPSILAAGILGLLLVTPRASLLQRVLCFLLLSMKVTYLFPAIILAIARREWRALIVGGGVILAACSLVIFSSGGLSTISSYFSTLNLFRKEIIDEPFKNDPTLMVNFVMLIKGTVGWATASKVSTLLFGIFQLAALLIALRWRSREVPFLAGVVSLAGILTFSPYVGWYEDVLVVPFVALLVSNPPSKQNRYLLPVCSCLLLIALFRPVYITDLQRVFFFVSRTILLVLLFYGQSRERSVPVEFTNA